MLEITETAKDAIRSIIGEDAPGGTGFRISVAEAGEDEAEIALDVAEGPAEGDVVIDAGDGVLVFLDAEAADMLEDSVFDAEAHGDHFHFSLEAQGAE